MAYDMTFKNELRNDRDDTARARVFDEIYPSFSEPEKAYCDRAIPILMSNGEMSENSAKALLAELWHFLNMLPDEQDRRISRGETIRAKYEWALALKLGAHTEVVT